MTLRLLHVSCIITCEHHSLGQNAVSGSGLGCCKLIVLRLKQADMFSNQLAEVDGWPEVQCNHCNTYIIHDCMPKKLCVRSPLSRLVLVPFIKLHAALDSGPKKDRAEDEERLSPFEECRKAAMELQSQVQIMSLSCFACI